MTLPRHPWARDPWGTSYGTDPAAVPDTPPSAQDGYSSGLPLPELPPPELSASGRGRRTVLIVGLVVTMAVALSGAAVVGLVFLDGLGSQPGSAPAAPAAAPDEIGAPPVPIAPTGTDTLTDPAIIIAKAPHHTAGEWCSLLTAEDIRAATGFDQRGAPDSTLLCTHYFTADAGYLFVSDIPAIAGAAYTVRGNSAILYQSSPTSCEVSVALNRSGGVLDIDVRGVHSPRVPLCVAAVDLAGRAFDRLPHA